MIVGSSAASVFDADLPTLAYDDEATPAEIRPRLRAALQQAPVALGPHGPEVLSYRLVRSVLRDARFQIPPGLNMLAQGISSGPLWDNRCGTTAVGQPLWDKVTNSLLCPEGQAHHRLRSLTAKAFTPRAVQRLHDTMGAVMNELVEPAEALNVLADRMRNPRLAGPAPWKPMATLSGPTSLPVEFDAN